MIVFIGQPACHWTYSDSSLYTNKETHEHILQFEKAEIQSELTEHALFNTHI